MIFVWTFDGVMQAIGLGLLLIWAILMLIMLRPWKRK